MKKTKGQADLNDFEKREATIKPRSKFFSHLSATLLTLLFTVGLLQSDLQSFKGFLIDGLFRADKTPRPHPAISLVTYDQESAARYQNSRVIPAEEIIQTITRINRDHPFAIALIAPVNEKYYNEAELSRMAEVFRTVRQMFVGYTDSESLGKNAPRPLFHSTQYLPGYVSRDTFSYGADSVSRRVMLSIQGMPTLYNKLSVLYLSTTLSSPVYPIDRIENFGDSTQTYVRWQGPAGTYKPLSTLAINLDQITPGMFANKIVLIGSSLEANKDADFIFTPFSRRPFHTPLLEGAAHSLATLINRDGLYRSSAWLNALIAIFIGLISVNLLLSLSPARGIVFLVGEIVLLLVVAWIAFYKYQYWLDIAHPLVILCLSYYLVIPYRLVDEYKKRWHYQEKSEFMAELEQLKSNFLSLISHDLKTPLARIQGSAELALNNLSDAASDKQKKSLQAILQTTEGLSNYVETILDLTRIESSKVQLNKTSKDINTIINEVVASKNILAREKNISIDTNLEPLFSFKFDVKLIQQVIANLVDNAIKYSPENSIILIKTKEEKSWVQVSISDQGCGIAADETEKIFTKFYRVENSDTQKTKGTGLGLYLVKYFVELHKGVVGLKSEPGQGSEFTISLPV